VAKPQWGDLPDAARAAVTARCGTVIKAESTERGIMPGLAVRLYLEDGASLFLKGIPHDSHAARLYARERVANLAMADCSPAPLMLWAEEADGWLLLAFQFIEGGRKADLSPGSADISRVLETITRLSGSSHRLPPVAVNLTMLHEKAAMLLADMPDGPRWEMYADTLSVLDLSDLDGDAFLHYDLHAGNLMVTDRAVYVLDWSYACRGAAWIDSVMLLPRLIQAGHTPDQAEVLISALPGWRDAPSASVTGLAALWTIFREYKALYGPEEGRGFRRQAAEAGRAWIAHRTRR
jgi:hypothetical protein